MNSCALNDKIYKAINVCQFKANSDEYKALNCFVKKHISGALNELYDFLEAQNIYQFSAKKRQNLIKKQSKHWLKLMVTADFESIKKESIIIGQTHDRHNISAELYILGYNKVVSYLQRKIFEDGFKDNLIKQVLDHITSRVLMDISLSLSSYIGEREKASLYFYDLSRVSSCNDNFKESVLEMMSLTLKYIGMQGGGFYGVQSENFLKPLDDIPICDEGVGEDSARTCRKKCIKNFCVKNQDKPYFVLTREDFPRESKELDKFFSKTTTYILVPIKIEDELVGVIEFFSSKKTEKNLIPFKIIEMFSSQLSIVLERLHLFINQEKFIESLHNSAFYDSLTGLANRNLFMDRLKQNLKKLSRIDIDSSSIIFLDVDDFKDVNDRHGHALGDEALKIIAKSISACVRQIDTVARFGGDEFVILLDSVEDEGEAYEIAERILKNCCRTLYIENSEIKSSVSIGLLMLENNDELEDRILYKADKAMYKAKKLGKGRICVFDSEFVEKINSEIRMLSDLEEAIKADAIEMYYQPIIDVESGSIAYFEALCRWHHPELGYIPPSTFINLAETSDLILDLGKKCFEIALRDMTRLRETYPDYPGAIFSVNMSVKQFHNDKNFKAIAKLIQESPNPSNSIKVEVTENLLLDSTDHTFEKFMTLKEMGVEVLIDDFGTGYSSLSYLNKFDFDYLKIDKIFIDTMTVDAKNLELIKAIIALSKSQNIAIIAEGIETKEQLEILYEMGCSFIQGYYFSKPLPLLEALLLIAKEMSHKKMFKNLQHRNNSKNKMLSISA